MMYSWRTSKSKRHGLGVRAEEEGPVAEPVVVVVVVVVGTMQPEGLWATILVPM